MSEAISWVSGATETATREVSVDKVIDAVRTGGKKLRGQIEQIKNRFESELDIVGDYKAAKRAVDTLKKALPAVLWSGTFSQRKNDALVQHSGLLCADLDGLNGSLLDARAAATSGSNNARPSSKKQLSPLSPPLVTFCCKSTSP